MVSIKYNSGESGLPITYTVKAPHTRYTLKELKKWWGLDEGVTESDLKKGYTWKTNIITSHIRCCKRHQFRRKENNCTYFKWINLEI